MRSYDEFVAAGIAAKNKTPWELGDIAIELGSAYGESRLEKWADDIEVSLRAAQDYRQVAAAFEKRARARFLPWTAHRDAIRFAEQKGVSPQSIIDTAESLLGDRKAMTYREFQREVMGQRGSTSGPKTASKVTESMSTQEKADLAAELIRDTEVATAVASDTFTRAAFSRAAQNVEEQELERSKDRQRRESPGVYGFARTSKVDNLLAKSEKYEDEAMDLINELVDEGIIKDPERQRWVSQLDRQSARIEFMKSKLAGDTTDEELRAFMGGGAA